MKHQALKSFLKERRTENVGKDINYLTTMTNKVRKCTFIEKKESNFREECQEKQQKMLASITLPLKIATCECLNCFHEEWTLVLKQWIK